MKRYYCIIETNTLERLLPLEMLQRLKDICAGSGVNPIDVELADDLGEAPFDKQLTSLINAYSKENDSDTPDYILASYLMDCLHSFNRTIMARNQWYGSAAGKDDPLKQRPTKGEALADLQYTRQPFPSFSDDGLREAKRVAAVAESINIMRTLSSHKIPFVLSVQEDTREIHLSIYECGTETFARIIGAHSNYYPLFGSDQSKMYWRW